jgi:hypothetical protein
LRNGRESDPNRSANRNSHPEYTRDHSPEVLRRVVERDLDPGHQDPDFAERAEDVAGRLDPDVYAGGRRGVDVVLQDAGVDHAERGAEEAEGDAADGGEVDVGFAEGGIDDNWAVVSDWLGRWLDGGKDSRSSRGMNASMKTVDKFCIKSLGVLPRSISPAWEIKLLKI